MQKSNIKTYELNIRIDRETFFLIQSSMKKNQRRSSWSTIYWSTRVATHGCIRVYTPATGYARTVSSFFYKL